MTEPKKQFDAVEMMRSIRDQMSAQIDGMTLEQELRWLQSQEVDDPYLRRLLDRVAERRGATGAAPPQR